MLTLTQMLWLMEDFVTSEDSILNIKNFSQTLSENSLEKCQTGKLIYLFIPYSLISFKFILTGNSILGNLS